MESVSLIGFDGMVASIMDSGVIEEGVEVCAKLNSLDTDTPVTLEDGSRDVDNSTDSEASVETVVSSVLRRSICGWVALSFSVVEIVEESESSILETDSFVELPPLLAAKDAVVLTASVSLVDASCMVVVGALESVTPFSTTIPFKTAPSGLTVEIEPAKIDSVDCLDWLVLVAKSRRAVLVSNTVGPTVDEGKLVSLDELISVGAVVVKSTSTIMLVLRVVGAAFGSVESRGTAFSVVSLGIDELTTVGANVGA